MVVIIPMLRSLTPSLQIKATTVIFALTIKKSNRSKIIRWRVIPGLVYVFTKGDLEARAHALGTMNNLSIDSDDRVIIGAFKAIPPLLDNLCERFLSPKVRRKAGSALYNPILCDENVYILEKTKMRAALRLMEVDDDKSSDEVMMALRIQLIKIMQNLALRRRGRNQLMDIGVVGQMLSMMREGEGMDAYCMALIYRIFVHCRLKFKELAMAFDLELVC